MPITNPSEQTPRQPSAGGAGSTDTTGGAPSSPPDRRRGGRTHRPGGHRPEWRRPRRRGRRRAAVAARGARREALRQAAIAVRATARTPGTRRPPVRHRLGARSPGRSATTKWQSSSGSRRRGACLRAATGLDGRRRRRTRPQPAGVGRVAEAADGPARANPQGDARELPAPGRGRRQGAPEGPVAGRWAAISKSTSRSSRSTGPSNRRRRRSSRSGRARRVGHERSSKAWRRAAVHGERVGGPSAKGVRSHVAKRSTSSSPAAAARRS